MSNLQNMTGDELANLQSDIKAELARRSTEKMIPVFGVQTTPLNQHEFSDPSQAISYAVVLLDKVLAEVRGDLSKGGLQGWNGNLLRIYVQHVSESDFAILQPHLKNVGFADGGYSKKRPDDELLVQVPAQSEGWQLVPKEITLEMECALSTSDSYAIAWKRALAVAPKYGRS